jgi:hypothetical protein
MFFEGWRNEVIGPALSSHFDVIFAATSAEPTSITTDIFDHLLNDPVAVFDLGGSAPDAPANPNVMYELGIRHAFRLPSVILAWEHQPLPFDIGDQRAVKIDRAAYFFADARKKISEFVKNASEGKFYDPLESLGHRAVLERLAPGDNAIQTIAAELTNINSRLDVIQAERRSYAMLPRPATTDFGIVDPGDWERLFKEGIHVSQLQLPPRAVFRRRTKESEGEGKREIGKEGDESTDKEKKNE